MRRIKTFRFLAFFFSGFLVGCIFLHILAARQLDAIYWEKEELKVQLYETNQRLNKLESGEQHSATATVKDIRLELFEDGEPFSYPPLHQSLYETAEELLGTEIASLNHRFLYKIFNNRIISLDNEHYRIEVEGIIIGEQITFFLEVSSYDEINSVN